MNFTPRHTHHLICALAAAGALAACTDSESPDVTGLGWVAFEIEANSNPLAPPTEPFALTMASADSLYSHTWPDIAQFPLLENFYSGAYTATAVSGIPDAEGYGCPCYQGIAPFEIIDNQYQHVAISCHLTQALATVEVGPGLSAMMPPQSITLHSAGHSYVEVDPSQQAPMLIMPGATTAILAFDGPDGERVRVMPDFEAFTPANELSQIKMDMDADSVLTLECGASKTTLRLTYAMLAGAAPEIEAGGFTPGHTMNLMEGFPAAHPVVMTLRAPAGMQAVTLTSICYMPSLRDMPGEADLWSRPDALNAYGLHVARVSDTEMTIDFTDLLESAAVEGNSSATFLAVCRDKLGRVSQPMALQVSISSMEMAVVRSTPAYVGVEKPSVTLALNTPKAEASDFTIYITDEYGNNAKEAPIVNSEVDSVANEITLQFKVDEGSDDIHARIDFMGQPKVNTVVQRDVAPYQINVDAFATAALIFIQAETPEITSAIARLASVKANGKEASINLRDEEEGAILIVGLTPSTSYTITPVAVANGFVPEAVVVTEADAQVPSGDFEDPKDAIRYDNMKSGGAYSVSPFPVFNQQNFTSFNTKWTEKHWANVNAKTFCNKAANHNTWYMQPSAWLDYDNSVSGSKSAFIASVGWSLAGAEIPPYTQLPDQYLPYNANVPHVDHRSAGKLFLGSYQFDPATLQERYTEGVTFRSRPSSLNGFFKYLPDATVINDYGTLLIEIINEDGPEPVVVATTTVRFNSSPDFIAFNAPLEYKLTGVKATRLKMMFSSSHMGGTIEEEDAYVPVTPDPEHARCIGSRLWIDNLSFSYSY